ERIIPLDGSVAEVVFALNLGANVVATDRSATWPPEASELPQIGYQRSLLAEPIAGFTPTVLIGTEIAGPEKTLDDLRRLGYPVVIVPSEATMQGPAEKIRAVAEALGVPNRGEELATQMEKTIVSNTQVFEEDMRPVVAALYIRGTGTQLVLGRNSATHWLINAAGGKNVADILDIDQYKTITAESLLRAEPDILLVPSAGLESVGGVDGLLEVGGISQTPAGINRAVLAYDDQLLLGNGPRTGDLLKQLAADFRNLMSQTNNN
ncbi:MAG: ABC transporter substrate-binding protein, partial [Actinomycetota bacterium]|nr:ABC transporter substrate-binding protein [Actinomycetota bacterium]